MKKTTLLFGALALIASPAFAQKGLDKLKPMIGNWEGTGTATMEAGAQGMPWTSVGTNRWILDGHFVQEDVRIDIGPGMPSMQYLTIYGWDAEKERVFQHMVGNMGGGHETYLDWIGDTMISTSHGVEEGRHYIERSTGTHTAEGGAFKMDRAFESGPLFTYVEGKFKPTDKSFSVTTTEASAPMAPPNEHLTRLSAMGGTYTVIGKDAAGTEISSNLQLEWIFGGHAMLVKTDRAGVDARGFLYWDPKADGLAYFKVDSTGRYTPYTGALIGNNLVFNATYSMKGAPISERLVVTLGDDARPKTLAVTVLEGAGDPVTAFQARYEPQADGGSKTLQAKFKAGSCCATAASAGKDCAHPCCVAAGKENKICASCN